MKKKKDPDIYNTLIINKLIINLQQLSANAQNRGKKNKLQKLEKYQEDENHFTINKAYNTPNNDNLIEEMEKESEKLL